MLVPFIHKIYVAVEIAEIVCWKTGINSKNSNYLWNDVAPVPPQTLQDTLIHAHGRFCA